MRTISCKLEDLKTMTLHIGYEGENDYTSVRIDAGSVFAQYPEAVPSLKVQPPKGNMYPVIVTRDGDIVIWNVSDSDTASNGNGEIQLTFTENTVVVKSCTGKTLVHRSLKATGPAPDPLIDFIDRAEEVVGEAQDAAEAAEEAAQHAPMIGLDGYWYKWDAETEGYVKTDTKARGEDGENGVGITSVEKISTVGLVDTYRINFTNGTNTTYTVTNGQDGSVPIDDTTPAANKVFSSAKVDEELTDVKNHIDGLEDMLSTTVETIVDTDISSLYVASKTIKTNVGVGNTVDLTPNSSNSYGYILSDCVAGDVFTVKGVGGDGPRAWAFVDSSNKLLSVADAYATCNYLDVTAPTGAAKAIFNLQGSAGHTVVKHGGTTTETIFVNVKGIDSSFVDSVNMFNRHTITEGKKYDSGVIVSDSDYYLSDYIEIKESTVYTYRGLNGAINYFDEDKVYISAESITTYDLAVQKTSVSDAKYCRLQMKKLYFPYDCLVMNEGSTGSTEFINGKLLQEEMEEGKQYAYSDMPIPAEYVAYGVKAVDGSAGTDFDNENPTLASVYDAFDTLVTAYPDYVTKEDLGLDQSETYHIYAYYFTPEDVTAASTYFRKPYPKINLLAGIHGSHECCENTYALYYLFKSLCENWNESDALEYLRWNVRFAVVPIQNPYGWVNGTRQNSRGVDLNRNFSIGWKLRESGTAEYGGSSPMSEAETVAIANFGEANKDAIFSVDLHGTGNSAVGQDSMIYCGTQPTDSIFYAIKSLLTKVSHYWDSLNITGLQQMNYHGFVSGSIEGDGTQRAYMYGVKGIHAMVLESFKNFTSSPYSNNSEEIMQMNADKLGYCLLYGLNHFKNR